MRCPLFFSAFVFNPLRTLSSAGRRLFDWQFIPIVSCARIIGFGSERLDSASGLVHSTRERRMEDCPVSDFPPPVSMSEPLWQAFFRQCHNPGLDLSHDPANAGCLIWRGPMAQPPAPKLAPELAQLLSLHSQGTKDMPPLVVGLPRGKNGDEDDKQRSGLDFAATPTIVDTPFVRRTIAQMVQRPKPTAEMPTISTTPIFYHQRKKMSARSLLFLALRRDDIEASLSGSVEEKDVKMKRMQRYLRLRSCCFNPCCVNPWHHEYRPRKQSYPRQRTKTVRATTRYSKSQPMGGGVGKPKR
jgi:hypothetical protein